MLVMRMARLKVREGEAVYHCMSRVVEKQFIFKTTDGGSPEADMFVGLMRRLETFCGVQVLTYCLMSNHFHLLVRVPGTKPTLSDEELVERVRVLNGNQAAKSLAWLLGNLREQDPSGRAAEELKARYFARMHDVSEFVRELKGRFAQWYNRLHNRYGVLWAERFKSVLVESDLTQPDAPEALTTMAAYIELNPVRAGLCEDPKDYRYCGYAEAVGGVDEERCAKARLGLSWVMESGGVGSDWEAVSARYRTLIFGTLLEAIEQGRFKDYGGSAAYARKVLAEGGQLSKVELLRCRVRYFTDGVIVGSQAFVDAVFREQRAKFSAKRKTAARAMEGGAAWGELRVFRDLKRAPIG
jgi:REP element-mobilizing transposase RayT